jgi:hypothetical protein
MARVGGRRQAMFKKTGWSVKNAGKMRLRGGRARRRRCRSIVRSAGRTVTLNCRWVEERHRQDFVGEQLAMVYILREAP